MKKLTIFTPTYNRANLLERLYNSLIKQTNKNFIWLIVDDGSTDNTKEVVDGFVKANQIEITYLQKANGGKYSAIDLAHKSCKTEFIACVDSDDYLLANAVENINFAIENYFKSNCVGFVGRKFSPDLKPLGCGTFENGKEIMFADLATKYNYAADTFLIFKTDIVKNFKFPIIKGEKFVTEKVLYNQFMFDYSMIMLDTVDYVAEYQNEGYTASSIKLMFNNPKGILYAYKSETYYLTKYNQGIKNKVLAWARFYAWKRLNKFKHLFKDELNIKSSLKFFGWILSFVFYLRFLKKRKKLV